MNDMHWRIRTLKERWTEEDAARDKREERARQLFLEAEANQTFTPIEEFLIKLSNVLSGAGASVEIDTWQHLDDQRRPPGSAGSLLQSPTTTVSRFHHSRNEYHLPR